MGGVGHILRSTYDTPSRVTAADLLDGARNFFGRSCHRPPSSTTYCTSRRNLSDEGAAANEGDRRRDG